ncbi:alpha/beta fold hydrolase [Jannaschia aquimarina]|uniref:RutD protein n=1 Tax=Jannaschia aquimarina TaxID=935700 RepID=A0A0D1CT65_9RHOB|nr:alpha/beta fold hydrolase [Jannaschia aquimarina]KIT17957.1 putative aminoacrylate hydrolase RutD [Jannaschia aquimarina]SNT08065.1 Pimeloyl-ACP methyl ester carboxylesterase [Jannaschia aquimarina]
MSPEGAAARASDRPVSGQDGAPVLALHCMLASGRAWRGVAEACARPLLCPDLPGHGRAAMPDGPYMDAALKVALAAAPDGPFDVLGHSFGAVVALRLMADHPDRIRRAVLVEPVLFAAADPERLALHRRKMAPYAEALQRGDRDEALRIFHGLWGDRTLDDMPDSARAYMRERIHLIGETSAVLVEDAGRILTRLPDLPVTFVTSDDPPPVMASIRDGLAARLPRMVVETVPGAGHMAPLTHPDQVARIVDTALPE